MIKNPNQQVVRPPSKPPTIAQRAAALRLAASYHKEESELPRDVVARGKKGHAALFPSNKPPTIKQTQTQMPKQTQIPTKNSPPKDVPKVVSWKTSKRTRFFCRKDKRSGDSSSNYARDNSV